MDFDALRYATYNMFRDQLRDEEDDALRAIVQDERAHPTRRAAALDILAIRHPRQRETRRAT